MQDLVNEGWKLDQLPPALHGASPEETLNVFKQLMSDVDPELGDCLAMQYPELILNNLPEEKPPIQEQVHLDRRFHAQELTLRQKPLQTGSLPMSIFYPLGKADPSAMNSSASFKLHIVKQPPSEITKSVMRHFVLMSLTF